MKVYNDKIRGRAKYHKVDNSMTEIKIIKCDTVRVSAVDMMKNLSSLKETFTYTATQLNDHFSGEGFLVSRKLAGNITKLNSIRQTTLDINTSHVK